MQPTLRARPVGIPALARREAGGSALGVDAVRWASTGASVTPLSYYSHYGNKRSGDCASGS